MAFVDMSLDRQREINARQRALENQIAQSFVEGGDEARKSKREAALRAAEIAREDQLRNEQRMIQQQDQDYSRNLELAKYGIAPDAPKVKNALGQEVMGPPTDKQYSQMSIFDRIAQERQKEKQRETEKAAFEDKVRKTQYAEEYETPIAKTRKAQEAKYMSELKKQEEAAKRLNAPKNPATDLGFIAQKKQVENTAMKVSNAAAVKNGLDAVILQLQDPNIPEAEKVKVGQGALKLLNSLEGADAVGAEEAKRLGSFLEYKIANFTEPGSFVGRDLDLFTEQMRNQSKVIGDRLGRSQKDLESLTKGGGYAISATPSKPMQPGQLRATAPVARYSPSGIKLPNAIESAQASPVVHPQTSEAIQWAEQNINDPRAQEILRRAGR